MSLHFFSWGYISREGGVKFSKILRWVTHKGGGGGGGGGGSLTDLHILGGRGLDKKGNDQ